MNYAGFSIEYAPTRTHAAATIIIFDNNRNPFEEKTVLFRPSLPHSQENRFARDKEGFEQVSHLVENPLDLLAFYSKTYYPEYDLAHQIGKEFHLRTYTIADSLGEGTYLPLVKQSGAIQPVWLNDYVIAYALRTKSNQKPVYLALGHLTSKKNVIPLTFQFVQEYRIPEIVRLAKNKSKQTLREKLHDLL